MADNVEIIEHIQVECEKLPEEEVVNSVGKEEVVEERPFTIDSDNLVTYYGKLNPDEIEEEIELMKVASTKELFELISADCQKYISIIEHYKKENLQTLFNVTIRRIEGHLLIKFKLNANDRWVEVGFFDDDNTDKETLDELKRMITYHLKNYDEIGKQRRSHIASQFEQDTAQTVKVKETKKALPDNYFDPKDNPELEISGRQKESAGYAPIPEHLKDTMNQMKSNKPFNLSDYDKCQSDATETSEPSITETLNEFKKNVKKQLKTEKKPNVKVVLEQSSCHVNHINEQSMAKQIVKDPEVTQRISMIRKIMENGDSRDKRSFSDMTRNMNSQQYMIDVFNYTYNFLETLPKEKHVYVYQFLSEVIGRQRPMTMVNLVMELVKRVHMMGNLTENQKQIIHKYDLDVMEMFNE